MIKYTDKEILDWLLYESEIFMVDMIEYGVGDDFRDKLGVTVDQGVAEKIFKPQSLDEDIKDVIIRRMSEV